MPTTHVLPESVQELQDIADCLGKAKKILVVTGAGISTNSGIPDFRSKNGLYSLIQAQFDAVACSTPQESQSENEGSSTAPADGSQEPPVKRRRLSREDDNAQDTTSNDTIRVAATSSIDGETIYCAPDAPGDECSIEVRLPGPHTTDPNTPVHHPLVQESIQVGGRPSQRFLPSSSPLSSPPPDLFDPDEDTGCSGSTSSAQYSQSSASSSAPSDSDSETDESAYRSVPTLSAQSSFSSRSSLPNMKGRELFDASIWADPMKTSVFYTFTTTLRQKIRSVAPTPSHQFISNLRDTGRLVRCYTQNIDEIEEKVGLTTSLVLGPGKKGRFSRSSRMSVSNDQEPSQTQGPQKAQEQVQGDLCNRGVECVFLHGSLRMLRCFRCGHTTPWDENGREHETLSGRQPSCPRCEGATAAREGRGKRALAVGKLRPDIVLYGEEHPNAHLISPIVRHDISLAPDIMLILGTSLKVHGLKVLIREFSKAVHSRGGKVVFVNFTKPPESVWSDVIDYWIQWDCDAWVQDLKERKPALWLPPGSVEEQKRKRKSCSAGLPKGGRPVKPETRSQEADDKPEEESSTLGDKPPQKAAKKEKTPKLSEADQTPNPGAKQPLAIRDDTTNGAFVVWKIMNEFARISGRPDDDPPKTAQPRVAKGRRPRHSAPAGQTAGGPQIIFETYPSSEQALRPVSANTQDKPLADIAVVTPKPVQPADYSILSAVKATSQRRRSKKLIEAEETEALRHLNRKSKRPAMQRAKSMGVMPEAVPELAELLRTSAWVDTDRLTNRLAALLAVPCGVLTSSHEEPRHIESEFPTAFVMPLPRRQIISDNPFFFEDPLVSSYGYPPPWPQTWVCNEQVWLEANEQHRAARY